MKVTASSVEELEKLAEGKKHSCISLEPNSRGKLWYCVVFN